jgi:hypothetical protein
MPFTDGNGEPVYDMPDATFMPRDKKAGPLVGLELR